jgi:hypothetical protein
MSPKTAATVKQVSGVVASVLSALALAHVFPALDGLFLFVSGLLGGGALIPQPGTAAKIEAAKSA